MTANTSSISLVEAGPLAQLLEERLQALNGFLPRLRLWLDQATGEELFRCWGQWRPSVSPWAAPS